MHQNTVEFDFTAFDAYKNEKHFFISVNGQAYSFFSPKYAWLYGQLHFIIPI